MTRRRLRPDEIDLWRQVTRTTEAMHRADAGKPVATAARRKPKPATEIAQVTLDGRNPPQPPARRVGLDLVPSLPERLRQAPVQMDRKTFQRMNRGKLRPEARIDLHGMTLDRAHAALSRFILASHGAQRRLVLVITGKGKDRDEGGPIPVRFGVLRHQVPQWLAIPPLSGLVLQVTSAHVSHGGAGAYYVYLRRPR